MDEKKRKSYRQDPNYTHDGTKVLTTEDISKRLKIGINKARELVKRKDFPSIRLGGAVRIPEPEFEDWIHKSVYKSYDV